MTSLWHTLVANLAVVALFISAWTHVRGLLGAYPMRTKAMIFGILMGSGAVASMLMSIELQPGVFFDLRNALLVISGFFGGLPAALLAWAIALGFRLVVGGIGVWSGSLGITMALAAGLAGHFALGGRFPSYRHVVLLGLSVVLVTVFSIAMLPFGIVERAMMAMALPIACVCFVATVIAGIVLIQLRRSINERELLVAAIVQAPDFTYVKNLRSEFAAVNETVAKLHKFADPRDMVGKTDFDIDSRQRAQELYDAEQRLMRGGDTIDFEEFVPDQADGGRWYSTSKTQLHDGDGTIIGLVGVTRDVTAEKHFQAQLTDSRNQLSYALTEMSDGLAMFDAAGTLVFCNERYRQCFPLTGAFRVPGARFRDILVAVLDTNEQTTAAKADPEAWLDAIAASLHHEGTEEINLYDGRWLHLKTRPTGDGASLVVVSDVTTIKQAEMALLSSSEQLRQLASTDALTGLFNRRAFDQAIEREVVLSATADTALSLLMIDIDRFKAYNDLYGHQAGDECLRVIGQCLRQAVQRPADLVARYGGEEFVAILPATGEADAWQVAEAFRAALRACALLHAGSDKGMVTASIGIATFAPGSYARLASSLIDVADKQMYQAKSLGRDRINALRTGPDKLAG